MACHWLCEFRGKGLLALRKPLSFLGDSLALPVVLKGHYLGLHIRNGDALIWGGGCIVTDWVYREADWEMELVYRLTGKCSCHPRWGRGEEGSTFGQRERLSCHAGPTRPEASVPPAPPHHAHTHRVLNLQASFELLWTGVRGRALILVTSIRHWVWKVLGEVKSQKGLSWENRYIPEEWSESRVTVSTHRWCMSVLCCHPRKSAGAWASRTSSLCCFWAYAAAMCLAEQALNNFKLVYFRAISWVCTMWQTIFFCCCP